MKKNRKGFTLAELLIAVAIIGVLVAISIPVFTSQLERSKQAVDLANMRSAKGAALADWMSGEPYSGDTYRRNFDAGKGMMVDSIPAGYGKSSKDASTFASNMNASRIPNDGTPHYIAVEIQTSGAVKLIWMGGGNASYLAASAPYSEQSLMSLKNMPNANRVKADQTTLTAIGEEILSKGWTVQQMRAALGIPASGSTDNSFRIADYYQLKNGSFENVYSSDGFKLTSTDQMTDILDGIGFYGGDVLSAEPGNNIVNTTYTNSLFYSDELATNQFRYFPIEQTKRSIIVTNLKTNSSGVVTQMTIYTKAMDNQANMNEQEKKEFEIIVKA